MQQVAGHFRRTTLAEVPRAYHGRVVELLPLDLPLELAGQTIEDEAYWKRRSQAQWTNCDSSKHGSSYKQLFFERTLQDTLEECDADALHLFLKDVASKAAEKLENVAADTVVT